MAIEFRRPTQNEIESVKALLISHDLPIEGVEENADNFLVAFDNERLIACAGIERVGTAALLRSVAVAGDRRGTGLGRQIVSVLLDKARSEGTGEIVLLTTTARDFFAEKLGFAVTARERFDATFRESAEWNLPRCSSAVVMHKNLSNS